MNLIKLLLGGVALSFSLNTNAGFINGDGYLEESGAIYGLVDTVLDVFDGTQTQFKGVYGNGADAELNYINTFVDPDYTSFGQESGDVGWLGVDTDSDASTWEYIVFELVYEPAHYIVKNAGGNRLAIENLFDLGYGVLAWEDNGFFNSLGSEFTISHVTSFGGSTSVPEPSIIFLMGAGLLGLGFARRRKQQA